MPQQGPYAFHPQTTGVPDAHAAHALEFIAERMAGIEWQLAELNMKLFQITTHLVAIAKSRP